MADAVCLGAALHRTPSARRAALALASFLAVLAILGSFRPGLPDPARAAEVGVAVLAWEGSMGACSALLRRRWGALDAPWRLAGAVLLASVPASAALLAAMRACGEHPAPGTLYGSSLALGLLLAFARRGLAPRRAEERSAAPATPCPAPPRDAAAEFLRRHAPGSSGRRLLALQAEDHYLRVHTCAGSTLILMRLRDAVAALGPETGWQPHRSYWVSSAAVARPVRDGTSWKLALDGGLSVPVSRANVPRLRALAAPQPASASR